MATVTTLNEALAVLNEAYETLGYADAGSNEITAANLDTYGALPAEQINRIFEQVNLILQQRFFFNTFNSEKNKFRAFVVDLIDNGFGILDIYQKFLAGASPMWNENEQTIANDLVGRAPDDVARKYHTKPMEKQFKTTVDMREYSKVFTATGLPKFIDVKLANLSTSAEYWFMLQILDELKTMAGMGDVIADTANSLNNIEGIKSIIEGIRATAEDMRMPNNLYNKEGIISMTDDENYLYLITTPNYMERLRNKVFAGAFNLSETDLPFKTIYAPNGTDLGTINGEKVLFWLIDRRALVIGVKTWAVSSFRVPNTLYINHWLSIEGIRSHNTFINCVAYTGEYGDFADVTAYFAANNYQSYTFKINDVAKEDEELYTVKPRDILKVEFTGTPTGGAISFVTTYLNGEVEITHFPNSTTSPITFTVPEKAISVGVSGNFT